MERPQEGFGLADEYKLLLQIIQGYDAQFALFKTWGGTSSAVALIAALSVGAHVTVIGSDVALLTLGGVIAASSWLAEAMFRKVQAVHGWRWWHVEVFLTGRADRHDPHRPASPAIAYTFWHLASGHSLWKFLLRPITALPHALFVTFALWQLYPRVPIWTLVAGIAVFVMLASFAGDVRGRGIASEAGVPAAFPVISSETSKD